jgi:hypothetical protein
MNLHARLALQSPIFDPAELLLVAKAGPLHWQHTNEISAFLTVNIGLE